MATYHFSIKSSKKGAAAEHANYISRRGRYGKNPEDSDLIAQGHGNLPEWAAGDPVNFWRQADKFERANGSAAREFEASFPVELSEEEQRELLNSFIAARVGSKPYQYAIHRPTAALGKIDQPHVHLMVCDRMPDGIERSPETFFKRFNRAQPHLGGCEKDSGAKSRTDLKEKTQAIRKDWADITNAQLERGDHAERVDHRSYKDRGIERKPERHLGRFAIQQMSEESKEELRSTRRNNPFDL